MFYGYTFIVSVLTAAVQDAPSATEGEGEEEEEIDEEDPLWKATLKLTLGDRQKAIKMLEDPDSLMQYPEIKKIMEEQSSADADDWEGAGGADGSGNDSAAATTEPAAESTPAVAVATSAPKKVASSGDVTAAAGGGDASAAVGEDGDADEEGGVVTAPEVLVEGDPREHLNLVFIGHVDAGKSTLSGSILYLMGKVDALGAAK